MNITKFTKKNKKNVTRVRNKAFEVVDVAKEERVWTSTPILLSEKMVAVVVMLIWSMLVVMAVAAW